MNPKIITDEMELESGPNNFYGIQATVRKFLFFTKKYTAVNPICDGTPMRACKDVMSQMTPNERAKATYRAFMVTIDVYGWCNGKPVCKCGEPSWWRKWDYITLTEKAKAWAT